MAITFVEEQKKQKYLFLLLIGLILLTFFILQREFLFKPKTLQPLMPTEVLQPKQIEINFEILRSPQLEMLEPFQSIIPSEEEEIGRENPFLPY